MKSQSRNFKLSQTIIWLRKRYLRFALIGLFLELLGVIPFLIDEAQRRSRSEYSFDCILCFIILFSLISLIIGGFLSIWKLSFIRVLSILLIFLALIGNILFIIEATSLKWRTKPYGNEVIILYNDYWNRFLILECVLIFASISMAFAVIVGVANILKKPKID